MVVTGIPLPLIDTAQNQIRMTPFVTEFPNMKFNQKLSNLLSSNWLFDKTTREALHDV
jgi:hypothetical protein